ncbi:MAG: T9SS type A sorting domain-containing protein [Bacteroidota bacterium]
MKTITLHTYRFFVCFVFFLTPLFCVAQSFCLRLTEISNDGNELVVGIEMQGTTAFKLGSSNLEFTFNNAALTNPELDVSNLGQLYLVNVSEPNPGSASFNIELALPSLGMTVAGDPSWSFIGSVKFAITNPADIGGMDWIYNGGTTRTVVFLDDEATQIFATNPLCLFGLSVALPVEMLAFRGRKMGRQIQLNWTTANELNNKGFEVLKSVDGVKWFPIGWVDGQGNKQGVTRYETIDENPVVDVNYYRLRQVDFDDHFSYSKVVSIRFDDNTGSLLYPNPASDWVYIVNLKNEAVSQLQIYDAQGRKIESRLLNRNELAIEHLANGIYYVDLVIADRVYREKLVISK